MDLRDTPYCYTCNKISEHKKYLTFEYYWCSGCKREVSTFVRTQPVDTTRYLVEFWVDGIRHVGTHGWTGEPTKGSQVILHGIRVKSGATFEVIAYRDGKKAKRSNQYSIYEDGSAQICIDFSRGYDQDISFDIEVIVNSGMPSKHRGIF